jgi:dTDP-4-dehydrorhamnose 3,5-epimerase
MQIQRFHISGLAEIVPQRFEDDRGYFEETFNVDRLAEAGIHEPAWVQDNQSYSNAQFTLRGLHYQLPPFAQAKLVRVVRGAILDVAVDIRPSSHTFAKWVSVELSAARGNQLYIPVGFAHGFVTLEPDSEVLYKVTARYAKECDRSIAWNDPDIDIRWPIPVGRMPALSAKDMNARKLAEARTELAQMRSME